MSYQPRPGDIGLTTISGTGGKMIKWGQWLNGDGFSDTQHAYGVESVDPRTGEVWIVEAMPGGARHVINWHTTNKWLICPDQFRANVAQSFLDSVDTPYSDLEYLYLAAHRFHLPAPLLRKLIKSTGHEICSQLVDHDANVGGWHLFDDGRWEGDVTPGDLRRLWRDLPAWAKA